MGDGKKVGLSDQSCGTSRGEGVIVPLRCVEGWWMAVVFTALRARATWAPCAQKRFLSEPGDQTIFTWQFP